MVSRLFLATLSSLQVERVHTRRPTLLVSEQQLELQQLGPSFLNNLKTTSVWTSQYLLQLTALACLFSRALYIYSFS